MAEPRKMPPETFWRVARTTLGRMACAYADPKRDGHNHEAECLHDDEAYAADLLLGLCAAATTGDEGLVLERLTDVMESLDTGT